MGQKQPAARIDALKAEGIDANFAALVNGLVQCEPDIDSRVPTRSRIYATPGIARCRVLRKGPQRIEYRRTQRSQSGREQSVVAAFQFA